MKRILLSLVLFLFFICGFSQAIQVNTTTYTVPQLVQNVLFGDGTGATNCSGTISNITWSTGTNFGSVNGIGYFTNTNPAFPLANGVILSSGNVALAPGPNANLQSQGTNAWVGDAQLLNYIQGLGIDTGLTTYRNASILEFDFVPVANNFRFDFLFASEEYGQYQCQFSDAFAFFLNNVTAGTPATNIALVPGTTTPISVITVRDAANNTPGNTCASANPTFFGTYSATGTSAAANASATDFNGTTVKLTAASTVVAGNTYHIKLVVADRNDTAFDSAVFLGGGSFDIGATTIIPQAGSGFTNTNYLVADNTAICSGDTRNIQIGNVPIASATYTWFQGTTQVQTGSSNIYTVSQPGTYSVSISYSATCTVPSTNNFIVEYFPPMPIGNPNDLISATNIFNLNVNTPTILNGQSPFNYSITYHTNLTDAQFGANAIANPNTYPGTNGQPIYTSILNSTTSCIETRSFLLNIAAPVNAGVDGGVTICDSSTATINLADLITGEDSGGVWTRTSGAGGTFDAAAGTFISALGATTSTFQYYLTAVAPAVDDFSIATVTINAQPNAGANGTITICDSNIAVIDLFSIITGEQPGGVWTRTAGTGGVFDATTATFTPAAGATTSTFAYTLTATAPCVDSVSQAEIIINPQPNAGADGATTVCDNSTTVIDLFSLITGEQVGGVWTRTGGTGGIFNAAGGSFTPAVGATSSTFQYLITALAPCVDDFSIASVGINPQPNAGTDGGTILCETSTAVIDLFSLISGEQNNGVWTRTSGTGGTFNAIAATYTPAVGATTSTFQYTIVAIAPCLEDTSLATITINTQPTAGTNGSLAICNDNLATIDLFGILTGEQAGGVWTRTSGTGGTFNAAGGTFTPTATSTSSTFNYTIAASAPCTPSQSTATITISNQPNAGTDGATNVCESSVEVIDLYALIIGEQTGGVWSRTSGTGGTFDATTGSFTPGFGATASTFEYRLIGTAPCVDDLSVVTITFVTAPAINQPSDFIVCDDSLNNDGIYCFDLTTKDAEVTTDPTVVVTYHVTQSDALTGNNPLPNPFCNNENINGVQTIYVRVSDPIATECPSTTSFQLIVNPLPLPNPIVTNYELCDYNNSGDGIELFDLSTKTDEIANGQTNVIITYYDNEPDAIAQNNPLPNNYSNSASPNQQTIWFNIAFNTTNCSSIGSFDLIVNPLPNSLQPGYPNYELCDNDGTLIGQEEFDLATKIDDILLGQTGMSVGFYPSLNEATLNQNEITNLLYTNQVPFQQTLGIRITNTATGCYVVSTMDLIVNSLPVLVQPTMPFVYCDDDQNGQTEIDLNAITPQIIGANNYTITYHVTLADAQAGNNAIDTSIPFPNNEPFMQTLYVRAVDAAGNGCVNVITIDLVVHPSPVAPTLSPLVNCDQDTNTQNGITSFNLELQTPIILNAQTPPTTNYAVSYYLTQAAAQSQSGPIIQTTNFQGSNNQVIWYTVRNTTTGCFDVGSFTLVVNTPIVLTYPTVYAVCDNDSQPNNLFTTFDLVDFVTNFSNPAIPAGYVYEFYTSATYSAASLIANPSAFVNTVAANQTIYVKVINTATGCYSNRNITLRVFRVPTPRTDPPALAPQCDYNNPGDGYEVFDLTVNAAYIANNDPNVVLHYFPSQLDAVNNTNEILNPTAASVNANVWIRVENNFIDYNNQRCYTLVEQPLTVNPLPIVNQAITDYQICQNSTATPGIAVFDLTSKIPEIVGTTQNPADFTVTFYTSQSSAQSGTLPIPNPTTYTNLTNPQTIYVRVVNNTTGCVNSTGVFQILVNPKPTATMPSAPIANCDTDGTNDGFYEVNLTALDAGVLNGQDPTLFAVTYYTSQGDADAGLNPITPANAYLANTQTVYIRVTNNTTGCYETTTVDIITEQLPEPIITTIGGVNVLCVNFTDDSIERPLQLVAENTIAGNYTYQWFEGGTAILGATNATYDVPFDPLNFDRDYTVQMTSTSTLACSVTSDVFTVIQSGKAASIGGGYTITNAFADNQIITVTIDGYGAPDYQFSLDDGPFQTSPIFENVGLGAHIIYVWDIKGQPFACDPLELLNVQTIDYPHYFTPNGDGIHDTWNINGLGGQESAKIYIFDRYGKLIKQISPKSPGWDGTYNGNMLPSTDYWFTVDFTEVSGIKQFKAHFSLKR
jgi:valyl-tRNA synthetase